MKILKRTNGQGIIYDTENIQESYASTLNPNTEQSLHHHHRTTDFDFLLQHFPKEHPIFILFGESYYYVV